MPTHPLWYVKHPGVILGACYSPSPQSANDFGGLYWSVSQSIKPSRSQNTIQALPFQRLVTPRPYSSMYILRFRSLDADHYILFYPWDAIWTVGPFWSASLLPAKLLNFRHTESYKLDRRLWMLVLRFRGLNTAHLILSYAWNATRTVASFGRAFYCPWPCLTSIFYNL